MTLKIIRIVIVLVILFLPSVEKLNETYKDSLWTSSTFRKRPIVLSDYNYSIGNVEGDTKDWIRFRLGFPVKPITIDIHEFKALQIRFEMQYFIYNLILAFAIFSLILVFERFNGNKKSDL